jgi:alpha-glucosidase
MSIDIDYMDSYKVFTLGPKFPLDSMRKFVDDLHAKDQHYIVMVDPAVAYQDYAAFNNGKNADIFLKHDGSIYKGRVWPGVTAFPDWFHENTQGYWDNEFKTFFSASDGVDIDGL